MTEQLPTNNGGQMRQAADDPEAPSARKARLPVPLGNSFNELFAGGASVWLKILGAAAVVPLVIVGWIGKQRRRGQGDGLLDEPAALIPIVLGGAAVGAFLGAALSMKDVVHRRKTEGRPVAFPLRALFGWGIWSVFVWIPTLLFGLFLAIGIAALTVGLN